MFEKVQQLNKQFSHASTAEILEYFLQTYSNKIALSSSFGAEDQVLTHMLLSMNKNVKIFTLDTGRLPYETYSVMDSTNLKYGIKVDVYFPDANDVEDLYRKQGINGFYESIENRKTCCHIRKIKPLHRALQGLEVWITGLRASQSITREAMQLVEYDENFKILKINPLIAWSEKEVWDFIKENKVPYNKLHDQGYPSIGCAPCTRAVKEGDDIRSGRWWWENPEHKECGLHKK